MNRRTFIKATSIGLTGTVVGLAGCSGQNSPPPRRSSVVSSVAISDDTPALAAVLEPRGDRWVQTRENIDDSDVRQPSPTDEDSSEASFSLSPIGTARAAKGRGTTSRGSTSYSSAPKTSKGRAHYGGGAYVGTWYNDHDDEVEQYPVAVPTAAAAYLGNNETFEEQDPGPGPVNWDETIDNPTQEIKFMPNNVQPGWYRVGTQITVPGAGENLGWEAIDTRVEREGGQLRITEEWKVSPRI